MVAELFHADRRTDRHYDANVAFRSFANSTRKRNTHIRFFDITIHRSDNVLQIISRNPDTVIYYENSCPEQISSRIASMVDNQLKTVPLCIKTRSKA